MPGEPRGVVQVAVAVPLRRVFDYRCEKAPAAGARVRVPFGRGGRGGRAMLGVVVSNNPAQGGHRLKPISEALDDANLFGARLLELLVWAARYYHHPLGEVLQTALPAALRKGQALADPDRQWWVRALPGGQSGAAPALGRAPAQRRLYEELRGGGWVRQAALRERCPGHRDALRRLQEKGLVEIALRPAHPLPPPGAAPNGESAPTLNAQQRAAVEAISGQDGGFASFLLHGVTGSGKTEVYLEAAKRCIAGGGQVLILVPEIALTPQLVARVQARLGGGVSVLHSGLPAEQRYRAWWSAREGRAAAVLGTRSAVFTPLKSPGLMIVDEEHDISYKQQDGFRYHARDLAIKRASLENIPVVLGSATPSMETRHNTGEGRHRRLVLEHRIGAARLPRIALVDLKKHRATDGISTPLLRAIGRRLERGEQSILFLNRRGFAPTVQCGQCGWQAACRRCDARLTCHRHRDEEQFQCHHCGRAEAARLVCADCGARLLLIGAGTQRLDGYLRKKFPEARISRLDRDRVASQAKLERELNAIRTGETDIIIGTQLIAKGHDFSRVTLVGVVNSDQGLYSIDFRAPEYLFQQLVQVSGRAGRAAAPGEVLVQTAHPGHPTLQTLHRHDFERFARHCMAERRAANCPPFSHLALWRAESTDPAAAVQFLRRVAAAGRRMAGRFPPVQIMDAVVSPMEKRAGRYRAQLLVKSAARGPLHRLLDEWIAAIENHPRSRRARWSIDIDPMEMF
ncbi:MAG: primosomal protein N' [Gammaproteobacteria bacterium]|nr:primosomal protein N' [Gammaproteobacteria bacterium]